jgi:nitroreductase
VVVTIDRNMGKGCFMDMGMAVITFLLAAEDAGLGATGIGAIANYGAVVHRGLGLPEDEMIVCGIVLGLPDIAAPINQFRTDRAELAEYSNSYGFNTLEEEEL